MKVILSRKGFDSANGGVASPILSDGTLLSLPIPEKNARNITYKDISYNGKSYYDIIKELLPHSHNIDDNPYCHLDPDIRDGCRVRPVNWRALFGQAWSAQSILENAGVGIGDLFLFFGWFKQTEKDSMSRVHYKKGAPDIHVIYGYLQIGEIYRIDSATAALPDWVHYHAHLKDTRKPNVIYAARERLTFEQSIKGWGCFNYDKSLVLTKAGQSRSSWQLPEFFQNLSITGKGKDFYKDGIYRLAHRQGQEFVIEENPQVTQWAEELVIRQS